MNTPATPSIHDPDRLAALRSGGLLDESPDEPLHRLTRLVSSALEAPVALLTAVDADRQILKSVTGGAEPWRSQRELPLSLSFCRYVVERGETLVIRDVERHPLARGSRAVVEAGVMAYAGTPLRAPDARVLGTLCALDHVPHPWTEEDVGILEDLGAVASRELEVRAGTPGSSERSGGAGADAPGATHADDVRRSEERYRLVTRATHDVIRDWDLATGGLVWGEDAHRVLRYTVEELGSSIAWWHDRIHPDDRERVIRGIQTAITGVDELWSDEYRILRGDGSCGTVLDRAAIVRDERGRAVRVVGSMADITERARAEAAQRFLAEASTLLDSSLDDRTTLARLAHLAIPTLGDYCLIDMVGDDEMIHRVAAAHRHPEKEEILYRNEQHPLDVDPERHPVVRVVRTGEPVLVPTVDEPVLQLIAHDDEHRAALQEVGLHSFMIVPLMARGRRLGAITLAADASREYSPADLVVAEDLARRAALAIDNALLFKEAQEAISVRDDVVGVVSHDLRNPLNTIQLTASLLLNACDDRRSENVKWLEIIQRSAQQMNAMIGDLLDLSSLEAGLFSLSQQDHDLAAVIEEACATLEPLAQAKPLRLECQLDDAISTVWIDANQILRVISNLVGNAIKFTPEGGRILIRAEPTADAVCISVADTGPGIPPEQLAHVFDRYWQARQGDRRGTGLGLAIARGIVEAHGGRIWAESEPGRGATVCFTVPRVRPAE
jgi:PAS domain S-box-containing protein